jgi:hypothetical protein
LHRCKRRICLHLELTLRFITDPLWYFFLENFVVAQLDKRAFAIFRFCVTVNAVGPRAVVWGTFRITPRFTNSMDQSFLEYRQEISHFFWNPKFCYRVLKNPPLVYIPNLLHPFHNLPSCFLKIHFNIIVPLYPCTH